MKNEQTIKYVTHQPMTAEQVLDKAAKILECKYARADAYTGSQVTKDFLSFKLGKYEREVFAVILLDSQYNYQELFFGIINAASVYPREVVKAVLSENAALLFLPTITLQVR